MFVAEVKNAFLRKYRRDSTVLSGLGVDCLIERIK